MGGRVRPRQVIISTASHTNGLDRWAEPWGEGTLGAQEMNAKISPKWNKEKRHHASCSVSWRMLVPMATGHRGSRQAAWPRQGGPGRSHRAPSTHPRYGGRTPAAHTSCLEQGAMALRGKRTEPAWPARVWGFLQGRVKADGIVAMHLLSVQGKLRDVEMGLLVGRRRRKSSGWHLSSAHFVPPSFIRLRTGSYRGQRNAGGFGGVGLREGPAGAKEIMLAALFAKRK